MKELTIEQKAKAYDEALERMKSWARGEHPECFTEAQKAAKFVFPELREESGDERIRKALIDGFTVMKESKNCGKTFSNHNIPVVDILAWLERQVEQKPAWSEEDEEQFSFCCAAIELSNYSSNEYRNYAISFLESLKDRVLQQPKQEWSEKDESYLNTTIAYLKDAKEFKKTAEKCINWLKFLRSQKQWKPSKEQIEILDMVLTDEAMDDNVARILRELREQLKKLKEG